MDSKEKAKSILFALENSSIPISWAAIDETRIINLIASELTKIERSELNGSC